MGRGESKPSGDSALAVCACMLCVCDTDSETPDTQLIHINVCVFNIQEPCSFFLLYNMERGIAVGFKGQPPAGL